jgi:hypothetical protein
MKSILRIISYLGLAITVLAPLLLWAGKLEMATNLLLLNIGMILWFGTAIFWIKPHEEV